MRRLDPTGDPAQAVASGFYVPPPNAVSQRIATRIELEPASSHLLVGGIGSGKTTELIAIERKLADVEDLFTVRIDVPSRHRLDKLKPGVLLALAAIELQLLRSATFRSSCWFEPTRSRSAASVCF